MKTLTLYGQQWRVHSPSLLVLAHDYPVWLAFNGAMWQMALNGAYAERTWCTRDEAAADVAQAFIDHQVQESLR